MRSLVKVFCLGVLLSISATSCTKTDLEGDNENLIVKTEGGDGEVKVIPSDD